MVVFPAPFGPSRPNTSPARTSKSMPFTASTGAIILGQNFDLDGLLHDRTSV